MSKLLRSEWIKFASVRSTWGVLAAFAIVSIGFTIIAAVASDVETLSRADAIDLVYSSLQLGAVLLSVVGVLAYGTEYRHNTISNTFVVAPVRNEVTAAKAIVYAVVGAVASAFVVLAVAIIGVLIFSNRNVSIELTDRIIWERAGQAWLFCVLYVLFGVGLGALVRQPTAAITIMAVLPTLVTGFLGVLPAQIQKFLPFNAGNVLISQGVDTNQHLAAWEGAAVLGAWAALVLLVGGAVVRRRDFL